MTADAQLGPVGDQQYQRLAIVGALVARRKWIVWVALVLLLVIVQIGVSHAAS